jgi:ABC-2 type transport system permease protein
MMVAVIAARELRGLFGSPLAWAVLAVVQFILGYMFLARIELFLQVQPRLIGIEESPGLTDIVVAPLFGNAGIVLLLVVPLLTMHLIAEERRTGTLNLLLAAPVSMTEIALGKFLGLMAFLLVMLATVALMPLSLLAGSTLDFGQFGAGLLGLGLLLAAFAAVGLFLSAMTDHPTVAAVTGFGALLLLWIVDWGGESEGAGGVLSYLSMMRHFESLLKGMFNSQDVAYFLLLTALFLALSIWRLDAERLQR